MDCSLTAVSPRTRQKTIVNAKRITSRAGGGLNETSSRTAVRAARKQKHFVIPNRGPDDFRDLLLAMK